VLPDAPPGKGRLWSFLVADAHLGALVALAGVPSLIGVWLLLSPGRLMSRAMTWDFLFVLSGAWHLHFGDVTHVDFHEPLAALNFLLPLAGFSLLGVSPFAFLASVVMLAVPVFALACWASWRRLPLVPAAIFVLFAVFLVLMPTTVGDHLSAASFAMSYNRYGWSAIAILTLILFVPPSNGRKGDWFDVAASAVLIIAMFYLKVTYFVASLAAVGLALLVCAHVRRLWKAWVAMGVLMVANALAPYSYPYLADLWNATLAGGIRPPRVALWTFLPGAMQHAPYAAALVAAVLVWFRGEAPLRLPAAMAFVMAIGLVLLSQNAEPDGVPLGVVMAFLIYDHLRSRPLQGRADARLALMLTVTVFPLFAVGASLVSLVLYSGNARSDHGLTVVDRTQLRGLAVPTDEPGLLEVFSRSTTNPRLLNRARAVSGHLELTAYEYVETLLEAADLLSDKRYPPGGIVVLDQVNPLPFMLGIKPPRGGNLWSGLERPILPAEVLFADASYVLIPKFSTDIAWTTRANAEYGAYLAKHFPERVETLSWTLLIRRSAARDKSR
jgi:hypothetical protein